MSGWVMVYGGDVIASNLSFEAVEHLSQAIARQLEATTIAWFDYQFPLGDGIGTHRLFLSQGVPIHFKQQAP